MKKQKVDYYRLLALLTVACGILYFYANIFVPHLIPKIFRIGIVRQPTTILVLGTDINFAADTGEPLSGSNSRTDTILLLRIDPVHYKVNILSIPRDSFVPIPGYGPQKINAANVFGGVDLVKATVANLTGKNVDYFVMVNPYALTKLVDLIGGINIYVDKNMYYVDRAQNLHIDLKEGWHRLSGKEAQDYIRFRHDAAGDIGRIERQQKFLQTLFLSLARPSNLIKAPVALKIATRYVKTDLSFLKIVRLANFARMLSSKDIRTFTASGEEGTSDYAGSILIPNRTELEKIVKDYF
jgi:LCP family protein required for cell wall assembly